MFSLSLEMKYTNSVSDARQGILFNIKLLPLFFSVLGVIFLIFITCIGISSLLMYKNSGYIDNLTQEVQVRIGLSNSTNNLRIARLSALRAVMAKEGGDEALFDANIEAAKKRLVAARKSLADYLNRPVKGPVDTQLDKPLENRFQPYIDSVAKEVDLAQTGSSQDLISYEFRSTAPLDDSYNQVLLKDVALSTERANHTNDESDRQFELGYYAMGACALLVLIVMGLAFWLILRVVIAPLKNILGRVTRIARHELTDPHQTWGHSEIGELGNNVQIMQQSLVDTVATVREGVHAIYQGSSEVSAGSLDLSARTEEQAASLEQTAASMEELTTTVQLNAKNARHANELALEARRQATDGGQIMSGVVQTMNKISNSSSRIANITSTINSIAFQTNILALNAAVEAARAGEQGRGFAVVASEVRNLAQRSAVAAKEIESLISESVALISEGSQETARAGTTMKDILGSVSRVTELMGEITTASDEQSKGITQVREAVVQMDGVTQQNAALVEQASAAATSLSEQAGILTKTVSVFRIGNEEPVYLEQVQTVSPLLARPQAVATTPFRR